MYLFYSYHTMNEVLMNFDHVYDTNVSKNSNIERIGITISLKSFNFLVSIKCGWDYTLDYIIFEIYN